MFFAAQRRHLDDLASAGRTRRLSPRAGTDFASNDYLALASSPRLRGALAEAVERGVPVGSGGSRLLRGNDPEHEALETEAGAFFGVEAALFLGSGYAANTALLSALPQRGDLIVYDALVHASTLDGVRLGRGDAVAARHNDADAFADAIASWRGRGGTGTPWIVAESLYSMDGDFAPLAALAEIADRHEAILLVDEAHATGVWGMDGRGCADRLDGRPNVITLKTMGKAMGCEGALVCGPALVRDFLVSRGRPFIFSTAPSPLMAAVARESLTILRDEPQRRDVLQRLIAYAAERLGSVGATATGSQIMPLVIGDNAATMRAAEAVQAAGFDVRGIRPPTVPDGTARLRISLTLHVGTDEIDALGDVLNAVLR
ncbi:8-amino-7-oxononanoate synthase [Sphingomonas gellani]|uniref:8-amino-7-oxononanoate synthase n=1 Tax=Sphingomonas gellani TaxID=1166340 RepID=A0A1H8F7X1_9SPHN|nr:8-amino-7-oxononanoate synthase [Sphingomonas gellani]SEN27735.1 8-amino-7-oxononanoate synthase [Sphingomonas gellani]